MVKCENCPCLNRRFSFKEEYDGIGYGGEWWYCGVDENDIGKPGKLRKNVTVTNCPIKQIVLKDGTVFTPEEIS